MQNFTDSMNSLKCRQEAFEAMKKKNLEDETQKSKENDDKVIKTIEEYFKEDLQRNQTLQSNIQDNQNNLKKIFAFNQRNRDLNHKITTLQNKQPFQNYIDEGDIDNIFKAIQPPQDLKYPYSSETCRVALDFIEYHYDNYGLIYFENTQSRKKQTKELWTKLGDFELYGLKHKHDSVINLSAKLQTHLDNFDEGQYTIEQFQAIILACLHSQDESLANRTDTEKVLIIIANIIICVMSLGIATFLQLAHSKITTGEFRFFFSETKAQQKAYQIEKECIRMAKVFS